MKKLLLTLGLILGFSTLAGPALSAPEINVKGDEFEDLSDGSTFGYYQNSGTLLFTVKGNNNKIVNVQGYLNSLPVYKDVILSGADVSFESWDANSGTWSLNGLTKGVIDFYAVKAGHNWAMYAVNPADGYNGSWSTYDLWSIGGPGTGGHPKNGGGNLDISHFEAYAVRTSIPEPATLALLGFGLIGVGWTARKRAKKQEPRTG